MNTTVVPIESTAVVMLVFHLKGGDHFAIKTSAANARHCIKAWRDWYLFLCSKEMDRVNMEMPMVNYHFYEGEGPNPDLIKASVLFQDISAVQYFSEEEMEEKK